MNKKTLLSLVLILLAIGTLLCLLYVMRKDTALGTVNPDNSSITYKSTDYGFTFSLPDSWQGYSIMTDSWKGSPLTKKDPVSGPKLLIRNPKWTESVHYEDIPILIFTIPQWDAYLKEDFSISAAPIKATELARNNVYVFALPPRWDYDYSEGYQEAQTIISGNPLKAFSITPNNKSEALTPKEATYTIGNQQVTLINGVSIVPSAPNSQSMITTRYFGNEVTHDFDGDGRLDTAFLITQNTGGSGTFYYVVIALNTARGYIGSSGILLGDRIAPQTTEMSQNRSTPAVIVINYAIRKDGEPFTAKPTLGKSMWVKLDTTTMQLGEVVQNFEGEADTSKMTLGMQTWNWKQTTYSNDAAVTPKKPKVFTINFKKNNTFSATTDCNSVSGNYTVNGNKIVLSKMISTLMYCDGSQESAFTKMLQEVQSYMFTSKGELILSLKYDSGTMVFR